MRLLLRQNQTLSKWPQLSWKRSRDVNRASPERAVYLWIKGYSTLLWQVVAWSMTFEARLLEN